MGMPRVLVTGAGGLLGPWVVADLRRRGLDVWTVGRSAGDVVADLCAPGMVDAVLEATAPEVVVHLAALSRIADCAADPQRAMRCNAVLPGELAARLGPRCIAVSTDLVFDGRAAPYAPTAPLAPLSVYGSSKAAGEERVLAHGGNVVRLPLLFGPDGAGRGATAMVRDAILAGRTVTLFTNEYRTPLHCLDAAAMLAGLVLELLEGTLPRAPRLLHFAGPERCSRWELGRRLCAQHGLPAALLRPVECTDPTRPRDVSLVTTPPATARVRAGHGARSLEAMLQDA